MWGQRIAVTNVKARFQQQHIRKPKEADIDRLRRQTHLGVGDAASSQSNLEFAQNMLLSADGNGSGAFGDVGMLLGDVRVLQGQQPDAAERDTAGPISGTCACARGLGSFERPMKSEW